MTHLSDDQMDRARSVPIERVIHQRGIKLRGKIERVGPCPVCGGDDRFSINTKKGVWNCRQCGVGGDVIKLVEHLDGCDFISACNTLAGSAPKTNGKNRDTSKKVVVATYDYHDQNRNVLFVKDRVQFQKPDGTFVLKDGKPDKTFRQRRPDPDRPGEWLANVQGVPVVPYRLPELSIAAGRPVLIVEGESKADLLWSWNVAATCCAGGAKKWKPEHSAFLKDADVVLVPDNDDAAGNTSISSVLRSSALPGMFAFSSFPVFSRRVTLLIGPRLAAPVNNSMCCWIKRRTGSRRKSSMTAKRKEKLKPLHRRMSFSKLSPNCGRMLSLTGSVSRRPRSLALEPAPSTTS